MKKKEKLQLSPPSASGDELVDSVLRTSAKALEKNRAYLNQRIAKTLEIHIRSLTDIPFNFSEAEVLNASAEGDRLVVSVRTTLCLPQPAGNSGEWLGTRKESAQFRRAFEEHLTRNFSAKHRRTLSNILHSEFDAFVRSFICVTNEDVMSRVPKTTERKGAGRRRTNLDPGTVAALEARSGAIRPGLLEIRNEIGILTKTNSKVDDEQCKEHLRKAYSDRYDWLPIFLENKNWGNDITTRKGERRSIRISDLTTWSAVDRSNLIALEELKRRTQQSVSLSKFQHRKAELKGI
jgi:hypothetical protein